MPAGSGPARTTPRRASCCGPASSTRSRSSTPRRAPCSARSSRRALLDRPRRRRYLHLGEQHLVRRLDVDARTALVSPATVDWYTQAKKETATEIVEPLRAEHRLGLELVFGRVSVTERVIAYQRKSISGGDTLETIPLDLPETSFKTEAVWFSPTPAQLEGWKRCRSCSPRSTPPSTRDPLLPLWAMCDRWDIGGSRRTSTARPDCR